MKQESVQTVTLTNGWLFILEKIRCNNRKCKKRAQKQFEKMWVKGKASRCWFELVY